MLQYGPILAALNTMKTNERIRIFHTRVKLRSRLVVYCHYPVACCPSSCCLPCLAFEILFAKVLDFFNMWVIMRTSTNFAHLASFPSYRICGPAHSESAMSDGKWRQSFLHRRQLSVREEREHELISSPVSTIFARSAKYNDRHNNVGRIECGESTGKLGWLKGDE